LARAGLFLAREELNASSITPKRYHYTRRFNSDGELTESMRNNPVSTRPDSEPGVLLPQSLGTNFRVRWPYHTPDTPKQALKESTQTNSLSTAFIPLTRCYHVWCRLTTAYETHTHDKIAEFDSECKQVKMRPGTV
jgi:hypothetical protein